MNRWLRSGMRAVLLMVLDVVAFVAIGITMGRRAPRWLAMPLLWGLAWPVSLFRHVLPNPTPGAHATSIVAWIAGGIIDIVWVTLLVDWLWRPRRAPLALDTNDDRARDEAGL